MLMAGFLLPWETPVLLFDAPSSSTARYSLKSAQETPTAPLNVKGSISWICYAINVYDMHRV